MYKMNERNLVLWTVLRARLFFPCFGAAKETFSVPRKGHLLSYVGDVVGTGSSRKSATNSILWYMGRKLKGWPFSFSFFSF